MKNGNKNMIGVIGGMGPQAELPLVFPANYDLPVYNSLSILAKAPLKQYYRKEAV